MSATVTPDSLPASPEFPQTSPYRPLPLTSEPLPAEVRRGLPFLIAGRLAGNTGIRFVFPFLPAISRGLGVSIEAAGLAISVRELSGLAAPVAGRAIDRGRRRLGMVAGLAGSALFLFLAGASFNLVWFTVAITAFSVTKLAYDTAMSTWIGDHVPWSRRGTIVGLGELSWAGSFLLAAPLLGLAIDAWGWRAAFFAVAAANLAMSGLIARSIAPDPPTEDRTFPRLRLLPGALGLYAAMTLLSFGMQLVFVVYGFWLEDAFGWGVATIGAVSILLGLGELAGTGSTIAFTDKIGKRRTVLIGSCLLAPPLALLGFSGANAVAGIALLVLAVTAFELTFVSGLPLITEIDPDARGAAVGTALALITVARAGASLVGTALYVRFGMVGTGLVAAAIVAAVVVIVATAVHEPEPHRLRVR